MPRREAVPQEDALTEALTTRDSALAMAIVDAGSVMTGLVVALGLTPLSCPAFMLRHLGH